MTADITNSADVIDVRDIIARVEALESETTEARDDEELNELLDLKTELAIFTALLEDLCGNGGDEQWRGDWYPVTLVRDSYFRGYAQELAEECGMIPDDNRWPCTCIDWDKAAWELRIDYTSAEYEGATYWYR